VIVSSNLHYRGKMKWEDLEQTRGSFRGLAAYNQSKLANVLYTKALARRLEGTGVTVNALHPGVIATELARDYPKPLTAIWNMFLLTPEEGAECTLHVATATELEGVSGEYFERSKTKRASKDACDEEQQERLWAVTEELIACYGARSAA
jgi:NAD(P)-dependent dehydrogenase (short-subunit alcohol dehydrogenase family)